jgi:ketosteroid isomerase-like protein
MTLRVLVPPLLGFHLLLPFPQASLDPMDVVEAERAFARDAAEKGTRAGFLAHLGEGSIVFEPGPVDARATWEAREARPGLLSWEPEYAAIAASGDLGFTTGPWEFRPGGAASEPVAFGEYSTVWRKRADGSWKFAIDIGIGHGPHTGPPAAPSLAPVGPAPDVASTPADVLAAERAFVAAARVGIEPAYREYGGSGLLLLRNGAPRADGVDAATALAGRHPISWEPSEAFVSEAGDFGYVYGVALAQGAEDSAGYLRVWHRRPDGGWEIALDVATVPPPGTP